MASTITLRSALARQAVAGRRVPSLSALRGLTTRPYSSSVHDNDPKVLEEEKEKNLTGKQHKGSAPHNNAPGWNEYLASTSEAYTKADKSDGETTEALTRKTIERIKHRHNPDDVMEGMESSDAKDEVEGPLKKFGKAAGEVVDKMENAVSGNGKRAGEGTQGRPRHWDSERSTPSEAAVKADRGET